MPPDELSQRILRGHKETVHPFFYIQLSRRCVITKARSRAPALRPRPLRPYVSAALCYERERGRRGNAPPWQRKVRAQLNRSSCPAPRIRLIKSAPLPNAFRENAIDLNSHLPSPAFFRTASSLLRSHLPLHRRTVFSSSSTPSFRQGLTGC